MVKEKVARKNPLAKGKTTERTRSNYPTREIQKTFAELTWPPKGEKTARTWSWGVKKEEVERSTGKRV